MEFSRYGSTERGEVDVEVREGLDVLICKVSRANTRLEFMLIELGSCLRVIVISTLPRNVISDFTSFDFIFSYSLQVRVSKAFTTTKSISTVPNAIQHHA